MKIEPRTLQAIATLTGGSEFRLFMKQLEDELSKADVSLRAADPENFQRIQGRASFIAELLQNVASASDDVSALKDKSKL